MKQTNKNQAGAWEKDGTGSVTTYMRRFNPVAPKFILYYSWEDISCLFLWGGGETHLTHLLISPFPLESMIASVRAEDAMAFRQIASVKHAALFEEFGCC